MKPPRIANAAIADSSNKGNVSSGRTGDDHLPGDHHP
jgi:hypothetical protein